MKTEEKVKETIKVERRKVFWRLYVLPWLISVILLLLISAGCLWYIRDLHSRTLIQIEEVRNEGIEEGKKIVQRDAIYNGHGEWEVDTFGIISFNWLEQEIPLEQEISLEQEIPLSRGFKEEKEEREYPYNWTDHEFGKSLGIDIEQSIIGSVRIVIQKYDLGEIEDKLKNELEEVIHREFDGFETYHRVK